MVVRVVTTTYYTTTTTQPHVSQRPVNPSSPASSSSSLSSSSSTSSALSYYTRLAEKSAPPGTVHLHYPARQTYPTTTTRATTPPPPLPPRPYEVYESQAWRSNKSNGETNNVRSDSDEKARECGYEYMTKQVRFVDERGAVLGRR